VNVIGSLAIYFSFAFTVEVLRALDFESDKIDALVMVFFWPIYILGTCLTIFYYAGVLWDEDEKKNILKWQNHGVPLSRYLHTTHSTSIVCVNIDLFFKNKDLLCSHAPESFRTIAIGLFLWGTYYDTIVIINYLKSGYFPYPFLNDLKVKTNGFFPCVLLQAFKALVILIGSGAFTIIKACVCDS